MPRPRQPRRKQRTRPWTDGRVRGPWSLHTGLCCSAWKRTWSCRLLRHGAARRRCARRRERVARDTSAVPGPAPGAQRRELRAQAADGGGRGRGTAGAGGGGGAALRLREGRARRPASQRWAPPREHLDTVRMAEFMFCASDRREKKKKDRNGSPSSPRGLCDPGTAPNLAAPCPRLAQTLRGCEVRRDDGCERVL